MNYRIIFILLSAILLHGCNYLKPNPTIVDAVTNLNLDLTLVIQPDTSSGLVNKDAESPQVTFYGIVMNTQTKQPESNVKIRVVGTDTPGGNTMSREDGSWTITLPIVPERNDENLTLFAIEIQKKGAVMNLISEYCKDSLVWELLDVKNPDSYMTAGVYSRSLSWGNLYAKIENHLYITMGE
jgi:hypothetical protein